MTFLDTVKCAVKASELKHIDIDSLKERGITSILPENRVKEITVRDKLPIGVHSIKIEMSNEEIVQAVIEFSSKILEGNYKNLISKYTIEEAEHNFNRNRYLQINPGALINAQVFRVDPVNDIYTDDPYKAIQAVSLLQTNKDFSMRIYGDYESVYFIRNAKTIKTVLKFYRKRIELNKKNNRLILSFLNENDLDYFSSIVRVEQTIFKLEKIRESFHIKDTLLSSVLLSEAKPNYSLYQRIKGGVSFLDKLSKAENKKEVKWIALIMYCEYDINKIDAIMKPFAKTNLWRERKEYQPILERLIAGKIHDEGFTGILNEIESKLSA